MHVRGGASDIMLYLKEATRGEHERLEALLPVFDPAFDRGRYVILLSQIYQAVAPLESRLSTLPLPPALCLSERLKSPALRADLLALGAELPPLPTALSWLPQEVPEALGAMYVLEGSSLGGQLISRHLQNSLGLSPERGLRYFVGYGPKTSAMWKSFGQILRQQVLPGSEEQVAEGARCTFALFGQFLRGG
ncbi:MULTISPECIES: biliverdin-producing heme oxygenase [unclassified Meiothermus]|uniref:biliverdin-producing heme oxygenase n=1 Tax=unclassified Meiothermus TaxID=370471 RepID=UPI001314FEA2|nr:MULTISPECIES: biliverdin-producing heme oxygenase [unclassified Meiothermus]